MQKILISSILLFTIVSGIILTIIMNDSTKKDFEDGATVDESKAIIDNGVIPKEKLYMSGVSMLEFENDISDIKVLENASSLIIIGKVLSVDGATNYNENTGKYHYISTYGTLKIEHIIKNDVNVNKNDIIPFSRMGGAITVEQYEKELEPRQIIRQGISQLTEEEKKNLYVEKYVENDIKIEAGKTYLMYLDFSEEKNKYRILGWQYGLREYNQENNTIKNNDTNEYEPLEYNIQ